MAERNNGGERFRDEDLLIEVLSRLDVKTLLQCKAVSKAWYSVISTPFFIKSHLNRALTSTSSTLIVRLCKYIHHYDCPIENGSYSLLELAASVDFKAYLGFPYSKGDYSFWDIFPEVYSVNRNIWRKIETKLSDIPSQEMFEICLHGFLLTFGHNGMMAFDLNKEVFICDIKLPVPVRLSYYARIADFKDSIAVIIFFKEKRNVIKLCTLDNEACLLGTGVQASWTMMLTVDVGIEFYGVYGLFNSVEILLVSDKWFSYNLDMKVGRYVHDNPFFDFDEVFKYTESLLPVAGSKLVNWSDAEDDNEESCTDSEEVSEESSVDSEDDDERSSCWCWFGR